MIHTAPTPSKDSPGKFMICTTKIVMLNVPHTKYYWLFFPAELVDRSVSSPEVHKTTRSTTIPNLKNGLCYIGVFVEH